MNFSVETTNVMLIGAIELALLFAFISVFLVLQNRSLKRLISKLRERLQALVTEIRKTPASETLPNKNALGYKDYLSQQIKATQARHLALDAKQDISLDIDLDVPLPRRVAALRYAILMTEKEATRDESPDWEAFQKKYELIFSYFEDYSGAQIPVREVNAEEIELLTLELTNAKKRINNLEKFKALYFDLDERWQSSKTQAQKSYSELSQMATQIENTEHYEQILNEYHSAYNEFGKLLEKGVPAEEELQSLEKAHGEIRHLRAVASEQHDVITDLQKRLENTNSVEEKAEIAEELQTQLHTQIRYVQESETCIKLLEDELDNANKEIEQLKTRVTSIPNLKVQLSELKVKNEEFEQQVYSLNADNRRLSRKIEQLEKAPPPESTDLPKYKRALAELQSKYNELEEKYLDLKIQQ